MATAKRCTFVATMFIVALTTAPGPASSNGRAPATAGGVRTPQPPTAAVVTPLTTATNAPAPDRAQHRPLWGTSWGASPKRAGVTYLTKLQIERKRGRSSKAENVYVGTTYLTNANGRYQHKSPIEVGALVFEPLARGFHRVLLQNDGQSFEVLPARQSSGATAESTRAGYRRQLSRKGTFGRINLVEFFKAPNKGGQPSYFAVYGEEKLKVPGTRQRQTLTHIVDIAGQRVGSVPYNFINVWNGTRGDNGYVLVEPLGPDGAPMVGTVLGIPIHKLNTDFAGTLADPSSWKPMVGPDAN